MQHVKGLKVHAEIAGDQVQRQDDGRHCRQGFHDVIGAVALQVEVHLHCCFRAALQAVHMVHHAFDVFQQIAATHPQHLQVFGPEGVVGLPGIQRLQPVLDGGALVFAHLVEVVQGQTGIQQGTPVVEAGARVEQLALPVVQLTRQFAAQIQVGIHHRIEHAQHQIGWVGRQPVACLSRPQRCGVQKLGRKTVPHGALGRVH